MSNHPIRKAVGKTLRSTIGSYSAFVLTLSSVFLSTIPFVDVDPDNKKGIKHEESIKKFDSLYETLTEQKMDLDSFNEIMSLVDQNDKAFDYTVKKKQDLSVLFRSNARNFIDQAHFDGNLSEKDVLNYMKDVKGDLIDPVKLSDSYQDLDNGLLSEYKAYATLRDCRIDSNTRDIEELQSCMVEKGNDLALFSLILYGGLGFSMGVFNIQGRIKDGANTKGFRDWEDGKTKTPFHTPPSNH